MDIIIIGSGNTATVMGGKIAAAGHRIRQVVGRRKEPVAQLAAQWGSVAIIRWEEVDRHADLYLVALSDGALEGLEQVLSLPGRLVVHTAGAVPMGVLRGISERTGVLYPLQSLRKDVRPFPETPLLIDAARPEDMELLEEVARTISDQVQRADDATRLKLHLSAVMVNNFANFLYTLAENYCQNEGLDFSLLLPLIRETAGRLEQSSPREVQTGPAVRGDRATIERHLKLLNNYQIIKELYELFTIKIEQYYHDERSGKI